MYSILYVIIDSIGPSFILRSIITTADADTINQ